ncbi:MAG: alpha/beta hydrolase [Acidimicrobiales bacterium]|nr:alpha/beta hydrolase [Acidimicrobiales bacterium]MDG1878357.1 alpha/beta hydrolase [Acidimicrobiales bacterium]
MEPALESMRLLLDDAVSLAVDIQSPAEPLGTFVACHPHPLFGGSRHDTVVTAMVGGALAAGWRVVRFDFRGAGASTGKHSGGEAERVDVVAVLDSLGANDRLVLGGYSFGADVALSIADERIERWVCSAPVLNVFDQFAAATDPRPTHLIAGAHDQFRSSSALREATARWHSTDISEVATADHFFGGAHAKVTACVREILAAS